MLSSLRGLAVQYEDLNPLSSGFKEDVNSALTPVLAQSIPSGQAVESLTNPVSASAALWSGYRAMDNEQINRLAQEIVSEVKARGPFLSLSQFVNREVSTRSPYNEMGALQAAIDTAALNAGSTNSAVDGILEARFDSNPMPLDSDGLASAGFAFGDILEGDLNEGSTGYLTQAEFLKPMAPVLSSRSDTFVIRSYGDVVVNGNVVAEVRCEVVAARRADYVDSSGNVGPRPWEDPIPSGLSEQFGREFKILSFRWLDPDEV